MSYICSSCSRQAAYLCTVPNCLNPVSCTQCSRSYQSHPGHSGDQKTPIGILSQIKASKSSNSYTQHIQDMRREVANLTKRMNKVLEDHERDIESQAQSTVGSSAKAQGILRRIRMQDQSLRGRDMGVIIDEINSSQYSQGKGGSQKTNLVVGCLKENLKNVLYRINMALKSFVPSWEFDKDKSNQFFANANQFIRKNIQQLALRELKKSRDYYPYNAQCHFLIGFHEDQKQKSYAIENARISYERCLSLDPKHVGALNNIGIHHQNRGMKQEARVFYEEALNNKQNPIVYQNIGNLYEAEGNYEDAIWNYEKAAINSHPQQRREYETKLIDVNQKLKRETGITQSSAQSSVKSTHTSEKFFWKFD